MEINIPPKDERSDFDDHQDSGPQTGAVLQKVIITDSVLSILPQEREKIPLRFDLHRVQFESVGDDVAMDYDQQR